MRRADAGEFRHAHIWTRKLPPFLFSLLSSTLNPLFQRIAPLTDLGGLSLSLSLSLALSHTHTLPHPHTTPDTTLPAHHIHPPPPPHTPPPTHTHTHTHTHTDTHTHTLQCCEKVFASFPIYSISAYFSHLNVSNHPTNFNIRQ